MGALRLSLKRKSLTVELEGEDGVVKLYTLRQFNGKERDAYLNHMGDRVKFNADGKMVGLKSFDGVQSSLVGRCLYDSDGELVSQDVLQEFPADALNSLFEEAQRLSALDKASEKAEKND